MHTTSRNDKFILVCVDDCVRESMSCNGILILTCCFSYVCVCVRERARVCVCVRACACVCMCVQVCSCICVCGGVFVCSCVYMCVCVRVHVHICTLCHPLICALCLCVCARTPPRVCSLMFAWTAVQDGCLQVCEQGTDRSPNMRNLSADSKITAEATSSTL